MTKEEIHLGENISERAAIRLHVLQANFAKSIFVVVLLHWIATLCINVS